MPLKERSEVQEKDIWHLSALYPTVEKWQEDFSRLEAELPEISKFPGTLASSAETLELALRAYLRMSRLLEKLYVYAHLRSDENTANSENLGRYEMACNLYARISGYWSFLTPEILDFPDGLLDEYLKHPGLSDLKRFLLEIVRFKPHTLSKAEENLLAQGTEVFGASERIFSQLNNADLDFGTIAVEGEQKPLTHSSFSVFLKNTNQAVRKEAFEKYYTVFEKHKNTIATTLTSSIKKNVYLARVKNFSSARARSLFPDNVPESVYDNLISTVSQHLPALHRYYELRRRVLGLDKLNIYDTYVPLVPDVEKVHSFEEASELILESLTPLGNDYVSTLKNGLTDLRWVDRYENKGKRSGAYSSGCYDSMPYILMNYKADNLHDVFTLAHEAGHSMHSYFSNKNQSYQDHGYTIFVAEVASTFNEELLTDHLKKVYRDDPKMMAYLINQQLDDIKGTLYRQTMFAEFERTTHAIAEKNEPLTIDIYRKHYSELLKKYFGPALSFNDLDNLECLRIPHFYSAFYVYKYATGISAAIALSSKVLNADKIATEKYLQFLKSGCSKHPLDLLKDAGVDMTSPEPIRAALNLFETLVERLERLLVNQ